MSMEYMVYLCDAVDEAELYAFVESIGGSVEDLGNHITQGHVARRDENLWVYHYDSPFSAMPEEEAAAALRAQCAGTPKTLVVVELGRNAAGQRSKTLAKWFCTQLLRRWPCGVVEAEGLYCDAHTLQNLPPTPGSDNEGACNT